jgi:hypothetical protein
MCLGRWPWETAFIAPYEEGEGTAEEEAADKEAARVAAIAIKAHAVAPFLAEKRRLLEAHRDARRAIDEWRESLGHAMERDRQNKQRGRLIAAIQEVQACALSRRNDAAGPVEDLLNDTVKRDWMPLLIDAMVGPDADPDAVKRMALEAGDKANINQIYSAGATRQQWDAFVAEYIVRQILWIERRSIGGKSTSGAGRPHTGRTHRGQRTSVRPRAVMERHDPNGRESNPTTITTMRPEARETARKELGHHT